MNVINKIIFCAAFTGCLFIPDPLLCQVRILPLGNSITDGNGEHNSYRRPLWHMLDTFQHQGRNYFVHPQGSDINPGTRSMPWQTLGKVNRMKFYPGDSILLSGNSVFYGNINLAANDTGDQEAFIVISSYGNGEATIYGGNNYAIMLDKCINLSLGNLRIRGSGRLSGNTSDGLIIRDCRNVKIDNLDISGFQHSGLLVSGNAEDISITNVYAHDNGFAGIQIFGSYPDKYSCKNLYIGHCIAENNPGDPTVLDNHSGNGILVGTCDSVLIEYCEAFNNGWDMPRKGNGPVGIWAWHADHVIIQHCISHHNKTSPGAADGGGFDLDGGVTNSVVQYCLSYENEGAGYGLFEYQGAGVFENNTVRYSVSINDGTNFGGVGAAVWNGNHDNQTLRNLYFYNNVLYNDMPQGQAVVFWEPYYSDVFFSNNVFLTSGPALSSHYSAAAFFGNDYWNFGKQFSLGGSFSFLEWVQKSGKEMLGDTVVGMNADPLLYGPGTVDITDPEDISYQTLTGFQMLPGSPLRDKGIDLHQLLSVDLGTYDFFGDSIPYNNKYDIGVHEYRNIPPVITSRPYTSVLTGQTYRYRFMSIDPNAGDNLKYKADSIPSWLAFTDSSHLLSGIPSSEDTGTYLVSLSVSDGNLSSYQKYFLVVKNDNNTPEFLSVPDTLAYEGCYYHYEIRVYDADTLDAILISIEAKSRWLEYNPDTRQLTGTPRQEDTGVDTVVIFSSDGMDTLKQIFILTVRNINDPPTITSLPVQLAYAGNTYNYLIKASDPDGTDVLNFAAPVLPGWLDFNPAKGLLSGVPDTNDLGYCQVQLSVSDASDTIDQSFVIQVVKPGNPLIIDPGFEIYGVSGSWNTWTDGGMVSPEDVLMHSGMYAARLTGYYAYLYQLMDILPMRKYMVKAWISTGDQDGVWFGVKNYGGAEVSKYIQSDAFTEAEISFATGTDPSPAEIYIWKESGGGSVYVDDFSIQLVQAIVSGQQPAREMEHPLLYPNPATGQDVVYLYLEGLSADTDVSVTITDISGRCFYRQEYNANHDRSFTLDLKEPQLPPGFYYLSIYYNNKVESRKLIINE